MNRKSSSWICCIFAVWLLGGCAASGARLVRANGGEGELSVWGPTVASAREGREALLKHCNGAYAVSTAGIARGLANNHATLSDPVQPQASAKRETRVRFRCLSSMTLARR